ncbi:flagellar motor switch protein FliN [Spirochaetia bacterium]|nr:flagellar motor switch protein FliN [Spirochaetia bacterium]
MSDSALSQDEVDALLAGADAPGTGSGGTAPSGGEGFDAEKQALQSFFSSTVDAQSSALSGITGATVTLKGPQGSFTNRDAFLTQLPDTVTVVKADFSSGFSGEHIFLLGEAAAKTIAGLINKEENIELDEMAMSVIGEAVGTMVGSQISALTEKTGKKPIAHVPPEATTVLKAVAALPGGDFFAAAYELDLGDGQANQLWEILGPSAAGDIARALNPAAAVNSAINGRDSGGAAGGGMPANSMNNMMGQPTNVQSVQFPGLVSRPTQQEAGNIGLIMDVYMEMTVELGRTRKLIKEILGMGEGTIIELDKLAGEPVDILVNHKLIAKGEVVVIDENFGVRVTEIVSPMERMSGLD